MKSARSYKPTLMVGDQSYPAYELRYLLSYVSLHYGVEQREQLCQEIGVGINELQQMQLVFVWQVDYVMAYLKQREHDLELGAKLGACYQVEDLGFMLNHLKECANLGDCLQFVLSHPELVGSFSDTLISNNAGVLSLRWLNTGKIDRERFGMQFQHSVCSMLALARQLTQHPIALMQIHMAESARQSQFLQDFTQCDVQFEREFYQWSIGHQELTLPILYDFESVVMTEHALGEASYIEQILNQLKANFPELPKLEQMALMNNISDRTLRRRLASAGTTYQRLVDQVRSQIAIGLIVQGDRSVVEIADLMGFSDVSHFRQSFKHWLGYPPGHFIRKI
ncbi:AraC family transcriptional regulator [Shewanella colwelliana]|uniref:AraC family transcriptional regulator n=1 Tax=Shewanella colwelliana TaxID=23 RepID=A0A1E5IXS3_SHECO|nr:AraC family transcriptional regulator [Shewanella colwelliana]MDX1282136.1 AraC family transcriptional regulator [Shewanella colwelliana]OEG75319.1 AraC family transcriptional regulator [Shewanella colwelliana]GIU46314.1 AraC family transcriptional regulator [Shewanella colwelliana]